MLPDRENSCSAVLLSAGVMMMILLLESAKKRVVVGSTTYNVDLVADNQNLVHQKGRHTRPVHAVLVEVVDHDDDEHDFTDVPFLSFELIEAVFENFELVNLERGLMFYQSLQ